MKSDVPRQRLRIKKHVALGTSTEFRVRILLLIAASFSTALVQVAGDDSGSPQSTSQNFVKSQVPRVHRTVGTGKNQFFGRGAFNSGHEVRFERVGDR